MRYFALLAKLYELLAYRDEAREFCNEHIHVADEWNAVFDEWDFLDTEIYNLRGVMGKLAHQKIFDSEIELSEKLSRFERILNSIYFV